MIKENRSSYPARYHFEHAANIFKELLEQDRIKFNISCDQTIDAITKVRILPNGRLNLLTVNELVRTNFHMVSSDIMDKICEKEK